MRKRGRCCAARVWLSLLVLGVASSLVDAHPVFRLRVNAVTATLSTPVEELLDTAFVPVGDVCKIIGARWEHDRDGGRLVLYRGERRREIPLMRSRGGAFRRGKWFLADCTALANALGGSVIYRRGEREVTFIVPTR